MSNERKPATLFQHPRAAVTFEGVTAQTLHRAKVAHREGAIQRIAAIVADLDDVHFGAASERVQKHYTDAVRWMLGSTPKAPGL